MCWIRRQATFFARKYADQSTQTMEVISLVLEQELKKAYMEMDDRKIKSFLLEQGGDWIRWHKNPPLLASCMGGVLKRKICSYPQQELFWDHF